MVPTWLSILSATTRDAHASLHEVPADKDGMWLLAGQRIPWPGYFTLPANQRCSCYCTIYMDFGMQEEEANLLIQEYYGREESVLK